MRGCSFAYIYLTCVLIRPNVAPSLGPLLGGVLADRAGWPWIFWFLTMISGFCLATLAVLLPETSRTVVGNGSVPAMGINRSLGSILCPQRPLTTLGEKTQPNRRIYFPNPLKCLLVLREKDTVLIVSINGIFYMTYSCIQASLSSLFIELYGFTELKAGLIYLPFGFGCVIASYISGIYSSIIRHLLTSLNSPRQDYESRLPSHSQGPRHYHQQGSRRRPYQIQHRIRTVPQ